MPDNRPLTFAAFLASEEFNRSFDLSLAPVRFHERLSRNAAIIWKKSHLLAWYRERWPGDAQCKRHVETLWAAYLRWFDAQPCLSREQSRELAGRELRSVFGNPAQLIAAEKRRLTRKRAAVARRPSESLFRRGIAPKRIKKGTE
jgi:hypothetical protein